MNIQSLKQRLSLRNISETFLRVVKRFPVATVLVVAQTAVLSYMVATETEPGSKLLCLLAFLSAGLFISIATSLWGEEQRDCLLRWIVEGVSLGVCALYCVLVFLTDVIPNRELPAFKIGNAAWIALVVLLIPFGSFLREKDDLKVWHFILSLCGALLISGIVAWVMTGGFEGLLFGTAALFDFDAGKKLPLVIMIVCTVLLFWMLLLALIPQSERKHNASAEMPSFLTKIVSWLLLPLLGCYILVLYAYGLNILIQWELPKGMISWLVSAVMAVYVLCYVLLYPQVTHQESWQSKVLTRWLPIVILPLLVLMSVGVVRRFADYGVTPPRLYLLTLLLWFYAICIVMLVVPRKRFRWIALSFAALFILSSGHPLNYYRLCRPYLSAKIDKVIAEKGLQVPFEWYSLYQESHDEELDKLDKEITYMKSCYGKEYISRWVGDSERYVSGESESEATRVEIRNIYYTRQASGNLCPQGYATFRWVDNSSNELPAKLTEDSIVNGVLHDKVHFVIPSLNGKVACSAQNISISTYSDRTIEIRYSGYMFAKE